MGGGSEAPAAKQVYSYASHSFQKNRDLTFGVFRNSKLKASSFDEILGSDVLGHTVRMEEHLAGFKTKKPIIPIRKEDLEFSHPRLAYCKAKRLH